MYAHPPCAAISAEICFPTRASICFSHTCRTTKICLLAAAPDIPPPRHPQGLDNDENSAYKEPHQKTGLDKAEIPHPPHKNPHVESVFPLPYESFPVTNLVPITSSGDVSLEANGSFPLCRSPNPAVFPHDIAGVLPHKRRSTF